MNNQTGPPVEGEDFYGREAELNFAWNHIKKGNSLILAAPRRVGKSSFAKKLLVNAKAENWNTFEINLEEIKSEAGFITLFIEKIESQDWWEKFKANSKSTIEQILSSIKPTIKYGEAEATIAWQSNKADVYEKLKKLLDHSEPTLIMVDEVTVLLSSFMDDKENGIENVKFFLNWLRSFRQITGTKIRWVFCSSIGIDNFTNQHNLSYTFNDVESFALGAFNEITSIGMLKSLAQSDDLVVNDELIKAMLNKIGWFLPYFLQILHFKFNYLVKVESCAIDEQTLDRAYKILIEEKHLNTWEERLEDYGILDTDARQTLNHICKSKNGASRNNLIAIFFKKYNDTEKSEAVVSKLLYMLKNDGYLVEEGGNCIFRSPLLRDFWFNRNVK